MNKSFFMLLAIVIAVFGLSAPDFCSASVYQVNLSSGSGAQQTEGANFVVQTLKYDPYPVNPGDWFDVWIQVQNNGQKDALDSKFEIIPDFPFSSTENLTQSFDMIRGTINANKDIKSGEENPQDNIIVLKYRLKVADNAKEGLNILNFRT